MRSEFQSVIISLSTFGVRGMFPWLTLLVGMDRNSLEFIVTAKIDRSGSSCARRSLLPPSHWLSKLKGKTSEKVAEEIALRKKNMLEMNSIFVEQYEELLFVAELVRGTNWEGQIAVAANIATSKKAALVAKAKDHHLKADVAPPLYKE
ncbi:uncharacterized protein Pyn_26280 [Prunus yedoensis var. nudiflora]|uniref:Uncharacterized protein n=1 Tax=Prunus yedoensis var. nudiflora TaxID=2094558 RepID=A0A314YE46_PRUYE|nr:uncharacterized protein Pyn_26280 [Prunus yedoensis var. nudiflora]